MVRPGEEVETGSGNGSESTSDQVVKKLPPKAPPKPTKKPERRFISQGEPLPSGMEVNGVDSSSGIYSNTRNEADEEPSERSAFVANQYYDIKSRNYSTDEDGPANHTGSRMSTLRVSSPIFNEQPGVFQFGTLQRPGSRNSVMTNGTATTLTHTPIRSSVDSGNHHHYMTHQRLGLGGNQIYDSVQRDHQDYEIRTSNVFAKPTAGSLYRASFRNGAGDSQYYNNADLLRNMNTPTNLVLSDGGGGANGNGGINYSAASPADSSAAALALNPRDLKKGATTGNSLSKSNQRTSANDRQRGDYKRLQRIEVKKGKTLRTESYKVIAFICGLFAAILLVMGLASSEWLITSGYRQGLFVYCVAGKNESVPFVSSPDKAAEGCHKIDLHYQTYTLVAAAFCVVSLLVDVFATLLTALGLRCRDPNKKYKYYRLAVYVMALALVTVLVALVIYPVCFAQIMEESKRPFWEFGWAYGVGWGASIFLFGGVILLLCDKESEEIYYKERTIVQYADNNSKA